MNVIHISTECYPAAKAGGMGDVVGSLPKYQNNLGVQAAVLMPKYDLPWFHKKKYEVVHVGAFYQRNEIVKYKIEKVINANLGFDLYCAKIPGKFDRKSVYLDKDGEGFKDEVERNISFQRAALEWMEEISETLDLVHCHDHMTGLIPFFMKYGIDFPNLREIPSIFSIHNAAYMGLMSWFHKESLPRYEEIHGGLLDWDGHIHSVASAIKCAWKVNTVSPSYMDEIKVMDNSLSLLFNEESEKCIGILNGIDDESWDPKTDALLNHRRVGTWREFKGQNKKTFSEEYGLDVTKPWISFIGRFSYQKGVDTIAPAVKSVLKMKKSACFIILGNGNKKLEKEIQRLETKNKVKTLIMYNEKIAHEIYASSDFILMPSRFEPCGLNQMFAMRYGTVPIVRSTGGLKDTVRDSETSGTGFLFEEANAKDLTKAISRALKTYHDEKAFEKLRARCTRQNFSWRKSAKEYIKEYKNLIK